MVGVGGAGWGTGPWHGQRGLKGAVDDLPKGDETQRGQGNSGEEGAPSLGTRWVSLGSC